MDKKRPLKRVTKKDALALLKEADLLALGMMADRARKKLHPRRNVSFVIDRNINYTNICINRCRFCAFWRHENHPDAYVISRRSLFRKIREAVDLGATQILIQGGLNPRLGIDYYLDLLQSIKDKFPLHVHGFSPPEITHMAEMSGLGINRTLLLLKEAGLDSIPGGGAEILTDRIREQISPRKIGSRQWLAVMREAHRIGMKTTATMMFGSIEEPEDIIDHLDAIRKLQDRSGGFTAFIPWSFQPGNTDLARKQRRRGNGRSKRLPGKADRPRLRSSPPLHQTATGVEYLRILALSRIYLDNVPNIQASWVTQGLKMAQVALRFGANDFGSTMIEENVVAAAGVRYRVSVENIIGAIEKAGFRPLQRDMYYNRLRRTLP